MQKVIQRAEHAQRIAARRTEKARQVNEKSEAWARRQTKIRMNRESIRINHEARQNRRTDWDAGPLAPRRDVGDKASTFGTVHIYNVQPPEAEKEKKPKWFHIAEGDRVVIVRGRDKGRIGKVKEVDTEKATVLVEGLRKIDVHVPEWLRQQQEGAESPEIASIDQHISLEDVKLVYPLRNSRNGAFQDVVIDRLVCVNRAFNSQKREWDNGQRAIPGNHIIVPWPEKTKPVFTDHEADTLRLSVEEKSFRPSLIYPPMPMSVIDELRNKYSRFRTRHDYEYITKKEVEDARAEDRKKLINTMRTPLQELADLRSREKKEPNLTIEQLAKIGEVIEEEQAKATNAVRTEV